MNIFERMRKEPVRRNENQTKQEVSHKENSGAGHARVELHTPDDVAKAADLAKRIMSGLIGGEGGSRRSHQERKPLKSKEEIAEGYTLDEQGLQAAKYQTKEDLPEIIQDRFSNTPDGSGFVRESAFSVKEAWRDAESMKVLQRDGMGRIVRQRFRNAEGMSEEIPEAELNHVREAARARVENWLETELDNARFQALEEKRKKLMEMGHDGYLILRQEDYEKTIDSSLEDDLARVVMTYPAFRLSNPFGPIYSDSGDAVSYRSETLVGQIDGKPHQVKSEFPVNDPADAEYAGSVMRDEKTWVNVDAEGAENFFGKFRDLALDLSTFDSEQQKKKMEALATFDATVDADIRAAYKLVKEEKKNEAQLLSNINPKF